MLHQVAIMDNGMQPSWGHLGQFGPNFGLSQAATGIPCPSASAFSLVPSQHGTGVTGLNEGVQIQNTHVDVMTPQVHLAQPQHGFFLTGGGIVQAHCAAQGIPMMDASRQAALMTQGAAFFNPMMFQQAVGLEMLGWNQFAGFPQVKQEPGIFGQMAGGGGIALGQAPMLDFKNAVTPEMLQMHLHLQNAQATALNTNFVQGFDASNAPVSEHQNSSENHSPEPNKFTPGGRVPRWKRRNNVKHVAGERARRARTSNKVKVIRGLLPQLSANASFNDMVQLIIDVAREAATEARKVMPDGEHKESTSKESAARNAVVHMPVVHCSDHRSMIRGSGSVASLVLDSEHRIVEASAALVKNVQGDLQESRERLVGEKLSTVVQPDHAESIAEEIATLRQALHLDSEARSSPRRKRVEGEDTDDDKDDDDEAASAPKDAAYHFLRRGVMCKAGPARGDRGTLKPLARMDAHVTVSGSATLVMFLSSDGIADIAGASYASAR